MLESISTATPKEQPHVYSGPYMLPVDHSDKDTAMLWMTPVLASDIPELIRIMNLSPTISLGLCSSNMTYPYTEANGERFLNHQLGRRKELGFNSSFAIRLENSQGPMIGLVSCTPRDHANEGLCILDLPTNKIENLVTHPLEHTATNNSKVGQEEEARQAQAENEARQCKRADAEGKQVLRCGELGYWISDEQAGKGYMTRVVRFVLNNLTKEPEQGGYGYDRIHGEGFKDNPGTLRVMEKAGMKYNTTRLRYIPKFKSNKQCVEYIWDAACRA
ncbi:hypothetical protein BGZ93_005061 [Podila epicladia]|nr:hypothetical protein BGZ92_002804 [Podila epicladia]KAG0096063.1 hypothetical protein BGZ93_005061 [Podila epicladia]